MDTHEWPCPTCDEVRVFVQPPCTDGHTDDGGECPEWACADCGTAVLAADAEVVAVGVAVRRAA